MDKFRPPKVKVSLDEHDEKGGSLFEQYMKTRKPELLLNASAEFFLSTNPERGKISVLCKGLYYREKGRQETNPAKAKKLFLKSMSILKKVEGDGKIVKEVELEFIKRKLQIVEKDRKNVDTKLFLRSAELHRDLGHEKAYNLEMSVYYLFFITDNMEKLSDVDIIKYAELMLQHAEKGEEPEQLHKTRALYHQLKAKHSHNTKEATKEWERAVMEIKQTSDKYHLEPTETEYLMSMAMSTVNSKKRNEILMVVAERYKKQGQKRRENFVRKLLSPVPIKAAQVVYLADQSIEKLRVLEKELVKRKGRKNGPFAIFYHLGYLLERIEDVKRILVRMAITRKQITELHIKESLLRPDKIRAGKPYSKKLQQILRKNDELRKQMKQDMESLFIYGNLLLDQWSYLIGYIAGYRVPKSSETNNTNDIELHFNGLLNLLQSKKYKGELMSFWNNHKKDVIWLNFHLRFFRNVFVEHLRQPWQRGNTMDVYGDDFVLHIPAAVGFIKPKEEKKILEEIYPLAPQKLKDMPDDYWEKKNLKRVLEVTLYYIDGIEKQSDREKVWNAWNKIGGSTPSYDTIGYRLFNYLNLSLETITKFLDEYPKLLEMGGF